MKMTPEINEKLQKLDCSIRFVWVSPTYKEHPTTGKPVVDTDPKHRAPGVYCQVIDNATKEHYATGYTSGSDENAALDDAFEKAMFAEKPLTPAQKFTRSQVEDAVASKDAVIADLQRRIAELEANRARKKPGRKPKAEAEQSEPTPV